MVKNVFVSSDDQLKAEMRTLMFALYDGQVFQIGKMLAIYQQAIESKGFESLPAQKLYNLFYSVKDDLSKKGLLRVLKHGIYYISSEGVEDYSEEEAEELEEDDESDDEEDSEDESDDSVDEGIRVIGEGSGEVYVYTYPGYEELAKLKKERFYRCKIGMTSVGHERRLSSGNRTEEPEYKKILLLIKTDAPQELEKLLHATLRVLRQQANDAPGKEWFITSAEQIETLYRNLFDSLRFNDQDPSDDVIGA